MDKDIKENENRSDEDILIQAKERFRILVDNNYDERKKQKEDAEFADEDQWPPEIRNARENAANGSRPVLTIDKINQYISQVVNDLRQNKPAVKVKPIDDEADVETAQVFQEIIRRIEDNSNADIAYLTAGESAVKVGEGYWRIVTDFVDNMSFDQEARIVPLPDMFKVYLGEHEMPDGSDAEYGFIYEDVPDEVFKRKHPKAKSGDSEDFAVALTQEDTDYWRSGKRTRVAEYFYKDYKKEKLYMLADGQTILGSQYDELIQSEEHELPEVIGERDTTTESIKWCKMTGAEILEKNDWVGKYIPIIKVVGKASNVNGKKHFKGLVRLAKDSLRAYNYWFSTLTEKLALAPKAPFVGAVGQFKTDEDKWRKANTENYAFLQYDVVDANNVPLPPPQRQLPAQMEVAMLEHLRVIEHDIKTSLGMFKGSVGESSPQQSGKALQSLVAQSDQGTFNFPDNVALSIRYCGRQLIDIIPKIYDTKRIVRILGEDGTAGTAAIDPEQKQSKLTDGINSIYNLRVGKYDVTASPGASYLTKRMEQSEILMQITQNQPEMMAKFGDLLFKSLDWPLAQEISRRIEAELPEHLKPAKEGEPPPEIKAALAQIEQANEMLNQKAQALNEAENEINQKGMDVGKKAIEAMAQMESIKIEAARVEVEKAAVELLKKEVEMMKSDPSTLDADTKVKVAQIEQETKYVLGLLNTEAEEKKARLAAGIPTIEDEEAAQKREDIRTEAIAKLTAMVGEVAEKVSSSCEQKEHEKADTSILEEKIALLNEKLEAQKDSATNHEDLEKPLKEMLEGINALLAYQKAPKKVSKDSKGDYVVRLKR